MTEQELFQRIMQIIGDDCTDPADDLIRTGHTLVKVGEVLRGRDRQACQRILNAAATMLGVDYAP